MLKTLRDWLKHRLAGPELDALERYRMAIGETDRWLAAHQDAIDALDYVTARGEGHHTVDLPEVRQRIRIRNMIDPYTGRQVQPLTTTPATPRDVSNFVAANPRLQAALDDLGDHLKRTRGYGADEEHPPAVRYEFLGVCGDEC
jgi:hypothetical protein